MPHVFKDKRKQLRQKIIDRTVHRPARERQIVPASEMKFLDVLPNTNRQEGTQEIIYGGEGGGRKMATPIRRISFEP